MTMSEWKKKHTLKIQELMKWLQSESLLFFPAEHSHIFLSLSKLKLYLYFTLKNIVRLGFKHRKKIINTSDINSWFFLLTFPVLKFTNWNSEIWPQILWDCLHLNIDFLFFFFYWEKMLKCKNKLWPKSH